VCLSLCCDLMCCMVVGGMEGRKKNCQPEISSLNKITLVSALAKMSHSVALSLKIGDTDASK